MATMRLVYRASGLMQYLENAKKGKQRIQANIHIKKKTPKHSKTNNKTEHTHKTHKHKQRKTVGPSPLAGGRRSYDDDEDAENDNDDDDDYVDTWRTGSKPERAGATNL